MSLYMLSRRIRILPCAFKQLTGSHQVQKVSQGIEQASYDIKTRCGYSSWPITGRCQPSLRTFNHVERYRSLFESRRHYASNVVQEKKSRKTLVYLSSLIFGMAGCSYIAAPLYYGSTTQCYETVEENNDQDSNATAREVVVQFNADVPDGMPWKFVPTHREVSVKPGESASAIYSAENQSSTPVVVEFTYKITPMKAAAYFKCVSLDEQRLLPGEHVDLPVFFYIDPKFVTDPRMDDINNLIISCTFSKVS